MIKWLELGSHKIFPVKHGSPSFCCLEPFIFRGALKTFATEAGALHVFSPKDRLFNPELWSPKPLWDPLYAPIVFLHSISCTFRSIHQEPRLYYQPLLREMSLRSSPKSLSSGRNADRTRENAGNRAYREPCPVNIQVSPTKESLSFLIRMK